MKNNLIKKKQIKPKNILINEKKIKNDLQIFFWLFYQINDKYIESNDIFVSIVLFKIYNKIFLEIIKNKNEQSENKKNEKKESDEFILYIKKNYNFNEQKEEIEKYINENKNEFTTLLIFNNSKLKIDNFLVEINNTNKKIFFENLIDINKIMFDFNNGNFDFNNDILNFKDKDYMKEKLKFYITFLLIITIIELKINLKDLNNLLKKSYDTFFDDLDYFFGESLLKV